jgi:hypothetical protein
MTALDYSQAVDAPRDPRLSEAIDVVRLRRQDGRWPLQSSYKGKTYFEIERVGAPNLEHAPRGADAQVVGSGVPVPLQAEVIASSLGCLFRFGARCKNRAERPPHNLLRR